VNRKVLKLLLKKGMGEMLNLLLKKKNNRKLLLKEGIGKC